jgi:hypothetical protein
MHILDQTVQLRDRAVSSIQLERAGEPGASWTSAVFSLITCHEREQLGRAGNVSFCPHTKPASAYALDSIIVRHINHACKLIAI